MTEVQELMIDNNIKLEGLCLDSMIDRFSNDQLYTLHCSINEVIEKKLHIIRNSIEDHIRLILDDTIFRVDHTKFIFYNDMGTNHSYNKLELYITYDDEQTMKISSYSNSYNLFVDVSIKSKPMAKFYNDDSCFINDIILNSLFDDKTNLKLTSVIEYMKINPLRKIYVNLYEKFLL